MNKTAINYYDTQHGTGIHQVIYNSKRKCTSNINAQSDARSSFRHEIPDM